MSSSILNKFSLKDCWVTSPRFKTNLIAKELRGGKIELHQDLMFDSYLMQVTITVPKGFVCDSASVKPRILWSLIPPRGGNYTAGAVLHDWLYYNGLFTRKVCDQVFREALKSLQVKPWRILMLYYGVRVGGWAAWNSHIRKSHHTHLWSVDPQIKIIETVSEQT